MLCSPALREQSWPRADLAPGDAGTAGRPSPSRNESRGGRFVRGQKKARKAVFAHGLETEAVPAKRRARDTGAVCATGQVLEVKEESARLRISRRHRVNVKGW